MEILQVIPLLRMFDVAKAREFYIDWLGFKVDWEHRFEPALPLYLQVSREGLVLHLTEHHGDASPGAKTFIRCKGLEAFHTEISAQNYSYNRPGLEGTPGDSLTVEVIDPFFNKLVFHEVWE